ncbi:MAG: hypothetical protein LBC23_00620 [Coriobacteriales bacterium]|jgi:hypothetical protein|nr:hypothetical protein [Coriobacteriales bacterium]
MDLLFVDIAGGITPLFAFVDSDNPVLYFGLALFLAGPLFFGITYARYRNRGERHYHERETPVVVSNLQGYDNFATRLTGQHSSIIAGANGGQVNGTLVQGDALESVTGSIGSLLPGDLGNQLTKLK